MSTKYDAYVEAINRADEAMQEALRVLPQDASELSVLVTNGTFRDVRATLTMAYGLQREAQDGTR
jgi:hypothetical protein